MLNCCYRSDVTSQTVKAWLLISGGVAITTLVPLVIGCLGKYGHIPMGKPLAKGLITSGSLCTGFSALAFIIQHIAKKALQLSPAVQEFVTGIKGKLTGLKARAMDNPDDEELE